MTVSNKQNTTSRYHLYDSTGKEVELEKSEGEKDIRVLVEDQLTFSRREGICFVALLWTFSITSMSPTFDGDHAASAYSRCGLTNAWKRYLKLCSSRYE
jgi:hypothetical protein